MEIKYDALAGELARYAGVQDACPTWPARSLAAVAAAGGWRWIVPKRWGGDEYGSAELLAAYEGVAAGCLSTALILTQRDGAVDLIARGENDALKEKLLPPHARGERLASIGISQLTTSRGRGGPKLRATPVGDGLVLDGEMPWVTGAIRCDEIVTGAVLPDERQVVACVPTNAPGLVIDPPMRLLAIEASYTSRVRCKSVRLDAAHIVRGPAAQALSMRTPVKPLVVSAVGLGVAQALCGRLVERVATAPKELSEVAERLATTLAGLRDELFAAAERLDDPEFELPAAQLRVRVNALLSRLAVAYLTVCKGTGFARPHDAERLLREAMFFHVWSAPPEVQVGTLRELC